ncbi:MAG: hypothetical protein HC911_06025 [Chloroflexaceae bacterium]|nr:hypothetical protein [Chloroflexaceae bacterium]
MQHRLRWCGWWGGVVVLFVGLGVVGLSPAVAQDMASVNPAQITINAYNNEVIIRNLRIQLPGSADGLELVPSDLVRASDGRAIPAQQISVTLDNSAAVPRTSGGGGTLVSSVVQIDLRGAAGGEFAGELLVRHAQGTLLIPLTVRVKHTWGLPLLALLGGLVAGIGLTTYRAQVQPLDELTARLKPLVAATDPTTQPPMPEPFRAALNEHIFDVTAALNGRDLGTARTALATAEGMYAQWRKQREAWQQQFDHLDALRETLAASPFTKQEQFTHQIAELERTAPQASSVADFAKQVAQTQQLAQSYLDQRTALQQLAAQVGTLTDPATQEQWMAAVRALQAEYDKLPLDAKAIDQHTAFATKVVAQRDQLEQVLLAEQEERRTRSLDAESFEVGGAAMATPKAPAMTLQGIELPPLPLLGAVGSNPSRSASQATWRLWLAFLLGYGVVLVLLAAGGFAELYAKNAVFGANGWADYLALMAWGFGAETSRVAITGMAGGVPGSNRSSDPPAA